MIIRAPQQTDIPRLKELWSRVFQESAESVDAFFETAFFCDHALVVAQGEPVGALYWLDGHLQGRKMACLFAVAVDEAYRGQGLGKKLVEQACRILESQGYAGALLVPAQDSLYTYYNKVGFSAFGKMQKVEVAAMGPAIGLTAVDGPAYLQARQEALGWDAPMGQYLQKLCKLYVGDGFCLALDGNYLQEYLGPGEYLPRVLHTLKLENGIARLPGGTAPAGMARLFVQGVQLPEYFGPMLD